MPLQIDRNEFIAMIVESKLLTREKAQRLWEELQGDAVGVLDRLVLENQNLKIQAGRLWGDFIGVAYVDTDRSLIDPQLIEKLPEEYAKRHNVIPLYNFGSVVTVATADPFDRAALSGVENYLDTFVSPVFAFPSEIASSLEIAYLSNTYLAHLLESSSVDLLDIQAGKVTADDLQRLAGDQAIIDFTHGLILMAIKERASDIHIEPQDDAVRIRFRIDGMLQEKFEMEKRLMPLVITRFKVMASVDISEHRRPQDGHISLALANRAVDLRLSCMPTIHGEKIVLRLLGQSQYQYVPDLNELSFSKTILNDVQSMLKSPNGIVFLTGPTGSGKTTTLYSMLKSLNSADVNITTIEDPVEYRLPGLSQIQVNVAQGLTFATVLRSLLRQDPDIILLGEIRDFETAQIACQAALTGHLVLTTMHTNNSLQAVMRLVEMGIEPYIALPSTLGVMAQRLVRRLCDHCKKAYPLRKEQMDELFIWDGETPVVSYHPIGCEYCNHVGYKGRIAIHESFVMDENFRNLLGDNVSADVLRKQAYNYGFRSLRYDGIKKVLRGLTSLEEVKRVTVAD
jgi:type IV pilus assembly protein PilB